MPQKKVLAIYYSLTQQTQQVMFWIAEALKERGHQVEVQRIQPVHEWTLPLQKRSFFSYWWRMAWLREEIHEPIHPLKLQNPSYDCVVLGFQPWNLQPSLPMSAFLESPQASVLRNKDVILVMTARAQWKRAYTQVKEKVARHGGRVVDSLVVLHKGSSPTNIVPTVYHLFENQLPPKGHVTEPFGPFGIEDGAHETAEVFGREVGQRLNEGPLQPVLGWRLAGKPQLLS